jgi:hypothetical protein
MPGLYHQYSAPSQQVTHVFVRMIPTVSRINDFISVEGWLKQSASKISLLTKLVHIWRHCRYFGGRQTSRQGGQNSYFLFGRSQFRVLAWWLALLTDAFPQYLHANASLVCTISYTRGFHSYDHVLFITSHVSTYRRVTCSELLTSFMLICETGHIYLQLVGRTSY